jgi:hypothetical protein
MHPFDMAPLSEERNLDFQTLQVKVAFIIAIAYFTHITACLKSAWS